MQTLLESARGSKRRIRKAVELMERSDGLLKRLELGEAIALLKKAVHKLEYSFLGLIRLRAKTRPLADALRLLSVAYFLNGETDKAKATIRRLLVMAPKTEFQTGGFPKSMAQLVDDERLLFDEIGTSEVVVKTTPPGARVYLNARRVGRSPLSIKGVRRGFNYLSARMPGYRTTTMGLEATPPKLQRVTLDLRKFKRDPLPSITRSFAEAGRPRMGAGLRALAHRLRADIVVLAMASVDQDQARLVLYAYDARLRELLKGPVKATVSLDFPKSKTVAAAQMLFSGVRLDGTHPPPPKEPKPKTLSFSERWSRFRRWRGFWPTVGAVAGVLVAGVVVGLAVGLQPSAAVEPRGWRRVVLAHPLARF